MDTVTWFVGLDYHQDAIQLCVMDPSGGVRLNRSCGNSTQELIEAVEPILHPRKGGPVGGKIGGVAIEACTGAADLADRLRAQHGWPVKLAHATSVARIKSSPDKSDYGDARLLADLSRVGYVPTVWLAPGPIRELRQLVQHRQSLVDQRRAVKLRIGALLREHRARPSGKLSRWSRAWETWLRGSGQLPDSAQWMVDQWLEDIDYLDERIGKTEQRLAGATDGDAVVRRLRELEGVGPVTAWVLRAFIGDFGRFRTGKQLSRYCGLSPCNASSGSVRADAGLIRAGQNVLRMTLIQAAHRLMRTSDRWSKLAESMEQRGKAKCLIAAAVANRWMRWMHHQMKRPAGQE